MQAQDVEHVLLDNSNDTPFVEDDDSFSCHGNAFARGNWYRGYTFGVFRQNEEKLPVAAAAELRRKMRLGARLFLRQ